MKFTDHEIRIVKGGRRISRLDECGETPSCGVVSELNAS